MISSFVNAPSGTRYAARSAPRPIARENAALVRLALPIMLIALVNMGMSLTDTAMVSVLFGAEALASVAVGSDLYSILFYLGAGHDRRCLALIHRRGGRSRIRPQRHGCVASVTGWWPFPRS